MAGACIMQSPSTVQILPPQPTCTREEEFEACIKRLEERIERLENDNDRLQREIYDVKDLAKNRIGELLKEIVDIRDAKKLDKERVNDLADWQAEAEKVLDQHADGLNKIWQATKKAAIAPKGKKTVARIEQLKEILKTGPRTFTELEKLLKISPKEMNRLVGRLDSREYEIFFRSGDGRQKVLRLRRRINNVNL